MMIGPSPCHLSQERSNVFLSISERGTSPSKDNACLVGASPIPHPPQNASGSRARFSGCSWCPFSAMLQHNFTVAVSVRSF